MRRAHRIGVLGLRSLPGKEGVVTRGYKGVYITTRASKIIGMSLMESMGTRFKPPGPLSFPSLRSRKFPSTLNQHASRLTLYISNKLGPSLYNGSTEKFELCLRHVHMCFSNSSLLVTASSVRKGLRSPEQPHLARLLSGYVHYGYLRT